MKYKNPHLSIEERLDDLLARMTLPEKVAQLYCFGRVVEMTGILFDEDGNLLPDKTAELFAQGACQLGRPAQRTEPRPQPKSPTLSRNSWSKKPGLGSPHCSTKKACTA